VINLGGDRAGTADPRLVAYLRANRGSARFLVATTNWGSAAPIIIETGEPVMALHGFGTDRILTADQLAEKVRSGEVRFFLVADLFDQGPGGAPPTGVAGPGGSDDVAWVVEHCRKVPVADWSSDTGGPRPATGETGLGESLYDCAGA
jgi:4-amino-4-deoxy-L-arabinose transferase-like glycosyltransferase